MIEQDIFEVQDIIYNMMTFMNLDELLNLRLTSSNFNNVYLNERLWKTRIETDYPDLVGYKYSDETWNDYYFILRTNYGNKNLLDFQEHISNILRKLEFESERIIEYGLDPIGLSFCDKYKYKFEISINILNIEEYSPEQYNILIKIGDEEGLIKYHYVRNEIINTNDSYQTY